MIQIHWNRLTLWSNSNLPGRTSRNGWTSWSSLLRKRCSMRYRKAGELITQICLDFKLVADALEDDSSTMVSTPIWISRRSHQWSWWNVVETENYQATVLIRLCTATHVGYNIWCMNNCVTVWSTISVENRGPALSKLSPTVIRSDCNPEYCATMESVAKTTEVSDCINREIYVILHELLLIVFTANFEILLISFD